MAHQTTTRKFANSAELLQRYGSEPGQINRRTFHNLRNLVGPGRSPLTDAFSWAAKVLDRGTISELDAKIAHDVLEPQKATPIIKCRSIARALNSATPKQATAFLSMAAKLEPETLIAIDRIIAKSA